MRGKGERESIGLSRTPAQTERRRAKRSVPLTTATVFLRLPLLPSLRKRRESAAPPLSTLPEEGARWIPDVCWLGKREGERAVVIRAERERERPSSPLNHRGAARTPTQAVCNTRKRALPPFSRSPTVLSCFQVLGFPFPRPSLPPPSPRAAERGGEKEVGGVRPLFLFTGKVSA